MEKAPASPQEGIRIIEGSRGYQFFRMTRKTAPPFAWFPASSSVPRALAVSRAMARPRPTEPSSRRRAVSPRTKGSKRSSRRASGMPGPLSSMRIVGDGPVLAIIRMWFPPMACWRALATRLRRSSPSRSGSVSMCRGFGRVQLQGEPFFLRQGAEFLY
jgi:hypothetical protein